MSSVSKAGEKTRIRRIIFLIILISFFPPQSLLQEKGIYQMFQPENAEEYFAFLKYGCKSPHFIYLIFFLLNLHLYKPDPPSRARIFLQNRENWEHRDILEMFYSHPRAGACCSCPLSPALLALYSGNFLQSSLPMSFFLGVGG